MMARIQFSWVTLELFGWPKSFSISIMILRLFTVLLTPAMLALFRSFAFVKDWQYAGTKCTVMQTVLWNDRYRIDPGESPTRSKTQSSET